jgi:CzcA family heavy metal efflux pump
MLNRIIRFSLNNRLLVVATSALLLVYGVFTLVYLPVDVLPDLNRPRVTLFLEANGMAPEEIETQVVLPVETALNGSPGVEDVRSSSGIGLGMIYVEFEWGTDVYRARQMVAEKLQTIQLPEGITPVMGPVSSIMGQIMAIAVSSDSLPPSALRTMSDFTIRRRLMAIKGVSQVIAIGGEKHQFQVLVSSQKLKQFQLTIDDIERALELSTSNSTGGFFNSYGSEVFIRNVARAQSIDDLKQTVIRNQAGLPVLLDQVADVQMGAAVKRGDAGVNGNPAVILTVEKQPGTNTVDLTNQVIIALEELKPSLPSSVVINPDIFQQKNFIEHSIGNVEEALRDGFILVIIVLFIFLLNFRTTIITLTAIPLSIVITAIVFKWFGISINTLTLGGLAIAIGELVDDAIVDVENVHRRLLEFNERSPRRDDQSKLDYFMLQLKVIFDASSEVRNSIVYATIIVVLVFIPLFYLQGIEGKIFAPLGIAYITSIIASLLVSLTVSPVLCSYLLTSDRLKHRKEDSPLVRFLKRKDSQLLTYALQHPKSVLAVALVLVIGAFSFVPFFGSEFLPPFNEGSFTVNLYAPAGTSLEESNRIGALAERVVLRVPEVKSVARRTGRAELDEHTEPVSNSEIDVVLHPEIERKRDEIIADIRKELRVLEGVSVGIGQPISHRVEHLMSGVKAQVAVKVFCHDLNTMRTIAGQIESVMNGVSGTTDVQMERQQMVPQLLIKIDREALKRYGLQAGKVARDLEVFYNGLSTGQIMDGNKSFDVLLRTTEEGRTNIEHIRQTLIDAPDGTLIPLERIAHIEYTYAINTIAHENGQRKMYVSCNVAGRDLATTVEELKQRIGQEVQMPEGAYIVFSGHYESQTAANRQLAWMSILALVGIFIALFVHFNSWRMVLQIMCNVPLALIGSVVAVAITGGTFSIATLVGFVTLTGIASRNGIMMISHYVHLIEHENEKFGDRMIIRGSLERLVPVLMTAMVAGLALIPLTLDAQAPGKEILYPVATVILGGLLSSTLLDIVVTPAIFKLFGEEALKDYFEKQKKVKL